MKKADAEEEYIRLKLIAKKTKNERHAQMANNLANRIKHRHLIMNISKQEITKILKRVGEEKDNFHIILKRNITREYGKMVYNAWKASGEGK